MKNYLIIQKKWDVPDLIKIKSNKSSIINGQLFCRIRIIIESTWNLDKKPVHDVYITCINDVYHYTFTD